MSDVNTIRWTTSSHVSDWFDPPLSNLLEATQSLIVYLSIGDTYLDDANDIPQLEAAYTQGLATWTNFIPELFATITAWSGGKPFMASYKESSPWHWLRETLLGKRVSPQAWEVAIQTTMTSELVYSMTTYGWYPVLWSSFTMETIPKYATTQALRQLLNHSKNSWWMTHGYKEPYILIAYHSERMNDLVNLLEKATNLPVHYAIKDSFVPHRIRIHQQ